MFFDSLACDKESAFYVMSVEHIQQSRGKVAVGAVIECQCSDGLLGADAGNCPGKPVFIGIDKTIELFFDGIKHRFFSNAPKSYVT